MTGKTIEEFSKSLNEQRKIIEKVFREIMDTQSITPNIPGNIVPHFTRGVGGSVRLIETGIHGFPYALVFDITEAEVKELEYRLAAAKRLNMNVGSNKALGLLDNESSAVLFFDETTDAQWGVLTEIVRPEDEQLSELQATAEFLAPLFELALGEGDSEDAANGEQSAIAKEIQEGMTRDVGGVNGKDIVANLNPAQDPSRENEVPARVPSKKTNKSKGVTNAEMRVKQSASSGGRINAELRFYHEGNECFDSAECVIQDDKAVYDMASATQDWLPVILSGERFSGSYRKADVMIDGKKFLAGELLTNFALRLVEIPAYSHMDPELVIEFMELLYSREIT